MSFTKRECFERFDGSVECFNNGFWYSRVSRPPQLTHVDIAFGSPQRRRKLTSTLQTGEIIKWSVLAGIFLFFMAWFIGGYMHAKRRMRKGLPLKAYHRVCLFFLPCSISRGTFIHSTPTASARRFASQRTDSLELPNPSNNTFRAFQANSCYSGSSHTVSARDMG